MSATSTLVARRLNGSVAWQRLRVLPVAYPALALLVVAAALMRPQLLSPMLLILILRQAVPLGLAVVGQSLAMRCLSIDLSIGGVVVATSYLLTSGVLPFGAVGLVVASLLFGLVIGAINSIFIVGLRASAVIVTLGVALALSGAVLALTQLHAPGDAPEALREFGRWRVMGVPAPVWVWVALLVPVAWAMRVSVYGRIVAAWGANPVAAMVSGLPGARAVVIAHLVSGLFAAASGCMLVAFVGVGSMNLGQDLALNALAAAILGGVHFGSGKGGMAGPAVAAVMLTFFFNFLTGLGLGEPGRLMLQGALLGVAAAAYAARGRTH